MSRSCLFMMTWNNTFSSFLSEICAHLLTYADIIVLSTGGNIGDTYVV